jgi:hypothetical protein
MMKTFNLLVLAAGFVLHGAASSAVIFSSGNTPGGANTNVLSNTCTAPIQAGNPVQGCLSSGSGTEVVFSGNEQLTYSGGQATLDAADGKFTTFKIDMLDPLLVLTRVGFNIDVPKNGDGNVTFTAFLVGGGSVTSSPFALSDNGQNKFDITTNGGTLIDYVTVDAATGILFEDVKQVRLDAANANGVPVPLPGTLALLGLGLGLASIRAKRRNWR